MKSIFYYLPFIIIATISQTIMAEKIQVNETEQESLRKWRCENYLERTSNQIGDNHSYDCGFTGAEWSVYEGDHTNWCLENDNAIDKRENDRESKLKSCRKTKTSPHSKENQVNVPNACKNTDKSYLPVKQINWSDYISERPMSPVVGGLIEYDFNKDSKNDYVFLEAKEHNDVLANFIICMSQDGKYSRYKTDIEIYSMPGLSFFMTEVKRTEDLLEVVLLHYERAYGRAYREVSYRFSTEKRKFIVAHTSKGTNNVADWEGAYEMTPPEIPKLFVE